jgi:hypothetical protein
MSFLFFRFLSHFPLFLSFSSIFSSHTKSACTSPPNGGRGYFFKPVQRITHGATWHGRNLITKQIALI